MTTLGTALVRVMPSMSGFAPALMTSVQKEIAGAGAGLTRAVSLPLIAGFAGSISAAVQFESGLAGVSKTTNIVGSDLDRLGESVAGMANRMPFTREQILSVVEAAGRFGVADDNLLKFSETALQLGTATSLGADEAAQQLSRLANIVKLPQSQFSNLGSAIVALGNDFPTTEEEIARFSQRLAQVSGISTASAADVLGMGAGMASLGIRAEMGGTAMSRVFFKINDAVHAGGESLNQFASIAGMSSSRFAGLWRTDSTSAVMAFIGGIRRLNAEGANTPQVLRNIGLGEIRVRDSVLRMASGYETMTRAVQTSRQGFQENTALQIEYGKRLDTTAAQWEIFKNRITNVGRLAGESLLPIANTTMDFFGPMFDGAAMAAKGFGMLPGPIQAVTVGLVALAAMAGPVMWLWSVLSSGATQAAAGVSHVLSAIGVGSAAQGGAAAGRTGVFSALGAQISTLVAGARAFAATGMGTALGGLAIGAGAAYVALDKLGLEFDILGVKVNKENVDRGIEATGDWIDRNINRWLTFRDLRKEIFGGGGGDLHGSIEFAPKPTPTWLEDGSLNPDFIGPVLANNQFENDLRIAELIAERANRIAEEQAEAGRIQTERAREIANNVSDYVSQQIERFNRGTEAVQKYQAALASPEWAMADMQGAAAGVSRFNQEFFSLQNIAMGIEQAYDSLGASLKKNGMNFDFNTEAGRENQSALQALAGAIDQELVAALTNASGSFGAFRDSAQGIRENVVNRLMTDFGLTKEAANGLADAMGLTTGDFEARFRLSGIEEAKIRLDLLASGIGLLDEEAQREISLKIATGDFEGALALAIAGLEELPDDHLTEIKQAGADNVMKKAKGTRGTIETIPIASLTNIRESGAATVMKQSKNTRSRILEIPTKRHTTVTLKDNASKTASNIKAAIAGIKGKTVTITTVHQTKSFKIDMGTVSSGSTVSRGSRMDGSMQVSVRVGDREIRDIVGAEVNGQRRQVVAGNRHYRAA